MSPCSTKMSCATTKPTSTSGGNCAPSRNTARCPRGNGTSSSNTSTNAFPTAETRTDPTVDAARPDRSDDAHSRIDIAENRCRAPATFRPAERRRSILRFGVTSGSGSVRIDLRQMPLGAVCVLPGLAELFGAAISVSDGSLAEVVSMASASCRAPKWDEASYPAPALFAKGSARPALESTSPCG